MGAQIVHQLGQPGRLADTGGEGIFCPQRPGQRLVLALKKASAAWARRSSELMAQLEGGRHCVVRTDLVCALSSGHWLHCLESPGPGDTAEPTSPSE